LPQYRGAAPINHVLINGETTTGVTTFLIDDKIDTGNILLREEVPVSNSENAGELHDKLMKHGARLVIKTLEGISGNIIRPRSQSEFLMPGEIVKPAPKIFPDFCNVNWNDTPDSIYNFIRGLSPYPCARSVLVDGNKRVSFKIFESRPAVETHDLPAGKILSDGKTLRIACNGGFINILSLQAEGKKLLAAEEFLKGFRIEGYSVSSV
jgi:methionyl-tRNA formyltransferase